MGQTDGRAKGQTNRQRADEWMEGRTDELRDRVTLGGTDIQTKGGVNRGKIGETERRMEVQTDG